MTTKKSITQLERENRKLRKDLHALLELSSSQNRVIESLTLRAGPIVVDRLARTITVGGARVTVGPRHYRLLEMLLLHKGQTVSAEAIHAELWEVGEEPPASMLGVCIHRLRRSLGPAGAMIRVVRGVGYTLAEDPPHEGA